MGSLLHARHCLEYENECVMASAFQGALRTMEEAACKQTAAMQCRKDSNRSSLKELWKHR